MSASSSIKGPRVLSAYKLAALQTVEGRTQCVATFCAAARAAFEAHGRVDLTSWIWVRKNPHGADAPAVLAVELTGDVATTGHETPAYEARVLKACGLGEALAVATVSERAIDPHPEWVGMIHVLFESYAGSELHCALIRAVPDPLNPAVPRRVLEAFAQGSTDVPEERFGRALHNP
ncbi:MAG: hypothetical protein ABW352_19025 [Polyangiales bacterium]